jgi:hypothetical protein
MASRADSASIHCGEEPVALARRLTMTTSLASSAAPTRASKARSAAASTSPDSSTEPRDVETRNRQYRPAIPAARVRNSTPSQCQRESPQRCAGSLLPGQPPATRIPPTPRSKANKAAARARSSSSVGSKSLSTRAALESSSGSTTSRSPEPRVFQVSPVSNSNWCARVCTSTAVPRPASRTRMKASPAGGTRGTASSTGNRAQQAVSRSSQGHRPRHTSTAGSARQYHPADGVARHAAISRSAHHTRAGQSAS